MKTGYRFKVRSIVVPQGTKPSSMSFREADKDFIRNIIIMPYQIARRSRYYNTEIAW